MVTGCNKRYFKILHINIKSSHFVDRMRLIILLGNSNFIWKQKINFQCQTKYMKLN